MLPQRIWAVNLKFGLQLAKVRGAVLSTNPSAMRTWIMSARALVMLTLSAAPPEQLQAQMRMVIGDAQSCSRCVIVREQVAVLRDTSSYGLIGGLDPVVAVDSRGRFYVSDLVRTSVAVFDPNGQLTRLIGRAGGGPGEFRYIDRIVVSRGDTLRVFDGGQRRETMFSPQHQLSRMRELGIRPGPVVVLNNGDLVLNAAAATRSLVGLPLHLVDSTGEITRSFGTQDATYRSGLDGLLARSLALKTGTEVYAAKAQEYVIELWNAADGVLIQEIVRDADWFKPWISRARQSETAAPQPKIWDGLFRTPNGELWVLVHVADPQYRRAITRGGPHGFTITDVNRYLDAVVEVIDPLRKHVVARQRFDEVGIALIGDARGNLLTYTIREVNGESVIVVSRLRLARG